MALSWFFGKKKEEKSIPVTVEAVEIGSDEDYAIIQANRPGIYPQMPPAPYPYTPLPYATQPLPHNQQPAVNQTKPSVQNQLDGVPFVLSPTLNHTQHNHLAGIEDLRRGVFQIAADINDSQFHYDFKLEHSILREATAFSTKN